MKKAFLIMAFLLALVLAAVAVSPATAEFSGFYDSLSFTQGLTTANLATRSGPATKYRDTGTYRVQGEWVTLISFAYDSGDVCWVQCEVLYGGKLRRLYTGLKRFNLSSFAFDALAEEFPIAENIRVNATSKAMYGPGSAYAVYDKLTVDKGQIVTLMAVENGYAQVEWTTAIQSYRAWVPLDTLDYGYAVG